MSRTWLLPLFAIASLTLVACSPAALPDGKETTTATTVTSTSPPSAVAESATPAPTRVLSQPAELDADAVVAAQEAVLGGIYDRLLPSVARIEVRRKVGGTISDGRSPFPFGFGDGTPPREFFSAGEGSGFLWDDEGHVVTNWHVVDGADEITVVFYDGTELPGELLGGDADSDLAVLKVDLPADQYQPVELGDSDAVAVGQLVAAIGNPFGQDFTLTSGIVSALGRTIRGGSQFSIPEVIQTDAAVNPGNSGGPLLDRLGRVIGINSQIISRSGSSAGVGFAIPINVAKKVIPALITEGRYEYAWLGIEGTSLRPAIAEAAGLPRDTRGALVGKVEVDGPADQAGLRGSAKTVVIDGIDVEVGGDVITGIDGKPVRTMDDLIAYMVNEARPGDTVTLDVLRDGQKIPIEVVLATRP